MRKLFTLIVIMSFAALFVVSCGSSEEGDSGQDNEINAQSGNVSGAEVSFSAPDLDGTVFTYANFNGKPLVINFWGTWCPPCKREMPDMQKVYDEFKGQGLEIIGMAVERNPITAPQSVKAFIDQNGYSWKMLIANDASMKSLGLGQGIPHTIFIGKDGKVVNTHTGMMTYQDFRKNVEQIL